MKYSILLDTNILIPLEDTSKELSPELAEMRRLIEATNCNVFIHPSQFEDIQRDPNQERRDIVLSRLRSYQQIQNPPIPIDKALADLGWKQSNDNDRIDNLLLFALLRRAINILVTNDEDIHKKARKTELQEQVYRLNQIIIFLRSLLPKQANTPVGIQKKFLYEFPVEQSFFDSLRNSYNEFDNWYKKKAAEQRQAWCFHDGDTLKAICIFKEEKNPCIVDNSVPLNGNVLKLCTFKVGGQLRGQKIGERLLYCAFKYAIEKHINFVYLHTFGPEQKMLVSLCEDFGFEYVGKYVQDDVYLKMMIPDNTKENNLLPLDYAIKYYPYYKDDLSVRKFIVPILPKFHEDLFSDTSDIGKGFFKDLPEMYSPQANCIKKAYLCSSNTKKIEKGSLLFFYRSSDRKSVECVGVVEKVCRESDPETIQAMVAKRTVYSSEELNKFSDKSPLIILFRLIRYFSPISLKTINDAGIKGSIQSIRQITEEQYKEVFKNV